MVARSRIFEFDHGSQTIFTMFEAAAFGFDMTLTLTTALIEAIHFTAVDQAIKLLTVIWSH